MSAPRCIRIAWRSRSGLGLIGAIAPLAIVDAIAGPNPSLAERRSAYAAMAAIIGILSIIPIYITVFRRA